MIPRVYVCGASYEPERTAHAIAMLRARGAEVTHDWTPAVVVAQPHGGDVSLSGIERWRATLDDLAAVDAAHVVLWLVSERGSTGAGFEAGYAFARGVLVIAAGPYTNATIFSSIATTTAHDDETGVEIAIRAARRVVEGRHSPSSSSIRAVDE
jgi:nucleoside 2-deoxyribosyltransferase